MIRSHALLWTLLVTAAVGVLFYTSHQTEELETELEARHRAVLSEREAIRVLRAEWAYLNEPGRLRELARRHTPLGPAMPVQIVATVDEIPFALPGLGVLPGLPLPPHKPEPGSMVSASPRSAPDRSAPDGVARTAAAPAVVPPRAPPTVRRPDPAPPSSPVQALLANFRSQQAGDGR